MFEMIDSNYTRNRYEEILAMMEEIRNNPQDFRFVA